MTLETPPISNTPSGQVAQDVITETPPPVVVEENNNSEIATENATDVNNNPPEIVDPNAEKPAEVPPADGDKPPVLTQEQLEAKLKEYELKEQEALELKTRLNIQNADPENIHLDTIEATLDNQAQQKWLQLCNQYGVDYTPQGIDKSMEELLAKDPKSYYEFQARGEKLYKDITAQKSEVRATRVNKEIGSFIEANKPILENSPIVSQLIGNYIQENYNNLQNPSQELGGLMEAIKMIYSEAIEIGKHVAKLDTVVNDKSGVSGNNSIATANTSSYQMNDGTKVFTRAEIAKMDTATFDKYSKLIEQQMLNGLIK